MHEDFDRCYRAVGSRDARFDGVFVTAVTSTGIYCRPSCPAQTPQRRNVRFYPTAAAAVAAGFRACRRCRPEAAPGSAEWDVRGDLAARALRGIAGGVVDADGVPGLARRLAVSERHLHRVLTAEVGAGPLALARTRRAQVARLLVEQTALPLTEVAFAAGFASIRQFNDTMRTEFGCPPSALRRRPPAPDAGRGRLTLRLAHRPPYAADAMLAWLAAHAVPGLEEVTGRAYRRTLPGGTVEVEPGETHVVARLRLDDLRDVAGVVAGVRRLFDLDADPAAVDACLGGEPLLARSVTRHPGLRVPGATDPFELAARAVVGQQVSVAGARTLTARLVAAYGEPLPAPDGGLTHRFPTATALAEAPLTDCGLTGARARTVRALAAATASGALDLSPASDRREATDALLALPGIGPWTAAYVAMRALGDPDAFPATDLALRRSLAAAPDADPDRWRPWRAYAAMHLWLPYWLPQEVPA